MKKKIQEQSCVGSQGGEEAFVCQPTCWSWMVGEDDVYHIENFLVVRWFYSHYCFMV